MAEIRCITKKGGHERWLPEKLARDKAFLLQMGLEVQDQEEDKKKFEAIIKPEPKAQAHVIVSDNSGIDEITPVAEVKTETKPKVKPTK